MIYRIYNETRKGYEIECVTDNVDELFIVLDTLILEENASKVLVIEHNIEEDYDYPAYLYIGDIRGYIDYKDNFYYRHR